MNTNIFNPGDALGRQVAAMLYRCLEDLGSTKGAYYVADPKDGTHHLASHYGWPRGTNPPEKLPADHPLLIWAHHKRRSFIVNDPDEIKAIEDFCEGSTSPCFFVTPVYDMGERIGLLVQRDRLKGKPYDLDKDEPRTLTICQELMGAHRELRGGGVSAPVRISQTPPPRSSPQKTSSSPSSLFATSFPGPPGRALPSSQTSSSASTIQPNEPRKMEVIPATNGKSPGLSPASMDQASLAIKQSLPASEEPSAATKEPKQIASPGVFLPEQRTFFWETAALLCDLLPLAAVALWMDASSEIRPILTYSKFPLSSDLKHQVLAYITIHIPHVSPEYLHIQSQVENLESKSLSGNFVSYLPIVLKDENDKKDLLLLLRMDGKPFTTTEQSIIQRIARILGLHLQESRLHERYHTAFLSVGHRILSSTESRVPHLRGHSVNTARLARSLAIQMELSSSEVESVSIAAILHDVGTLLLDPQIFDKPTLTSEEWLKLRTHPVLASTFLKNFNFPFDVLKIIRHHHEWWNGHGYPDGLVGDATPIGSRIIALIEAYEVMSTGTPYKTSMTRREIEDELRLKAGIQFDPIIVSEFLRLLTTNPQP